MTHLTGNIARRLTPQPVKVRADIEATCFAYSGIDAIRTALKLGESIGTQSIPIKIRLVAPPLYVMVSNATDKQGAIELLETAIERIAESLKKDGGQLAVKMKVSTHPSSLRALFSFFSRSINKVYSPIS
jgi:translation initiation factor 2 subunit 1